MKFTKHTTATQRIINQNALGVDFKYPYEPTNIVFDHTSKTYLIADHRNGRVFRCSLKKNSCAEIVLEGSDYFGLAVDDDGFFYVSDTQRHSVRRYRPGDRKGIVVAGNHGQGNHLNQLNHPTYIFVGLDKAVYVSDSWNDRVVRWDMGAIEGVVVAGGQGKGRNPSQLTHPTGLVVDQCGTVYVADYWNNRVMQWHRGATCGRRIAGHVRLSGYKANQLNGPEGLAFDSFGNLYVADSNNRRIQRYLIDSDNQ